MHVYPIQEILFVRDFMEKLIIICKENAHGRMMHVYPLQQILIQKARVIQGGPFYLIVFCANFWS